MWLLGGYAVVKVFGCYFVVISWLFRGYFVVIFGYVKPVTVVTNTSQQVHASRRPHLLRPHRSESPEPSLAVPRERFGNAGFIRIFGW